VDDSQQRYADIFNATSDAIFIHDAETGEVLDVNDRMLEMYGCTREQVVGGSVEDFTAGVEPYTLAEAAEKVRQAIDEGPQVFEWRAKRSDGELFWVEVALRSTTIADKQCVLAAVRDITDRKRTEEELRESKGRLLSVFRAAPTGIGVVTDRVVKQVNERLCEMTGYSEEELTGQNARMLYVSDDDYEYVGSEKYRQIRERGTGTVETRWRRKDGRVINVLLSSTPMDLGDLLKGVTFTALDITARKQAEEEREKLEAQLRQSQKMEAVGQLAGGIAHDFNNLLQVILGYGEMAQRQTQPGSELHEHLHEVLNAGDRAKVLVSQLLAFSRRQVLEMEDLDINEVIADLMKMIRRVIGEHIALDILPGHDLGIVRADRGQVTQMLTNLCVNARDAMPEGGTITIETENARIDEAYCESHAWSKPGRYILLSVTDSGCGMDKETVARVFEPFFTTKDVGKGTGLGLSIVYGLVKQHEGQIDIYSEVGKGTRFKIYLPLIERSAAVVGEEIEDLVPDGTETILLAEDDEMVLKLSNAILTRAGYTVLTAVDGEEAIGVFNAQADSIDLAILDVVMPKLGGRAVFEQIRAKRPKLRVLFSSGYSMNAIHTNFVLDEGLTLIQKPYQRADLLRKIRETLDNK
jgi:two-component system, cell cycle sensor histidine kinase and response regulator CckA